MLTLKEKATYEINIKKSRFIAIAYPVSNTKEIKEVIKKTWEEHPSARHVVHAAIIGKSGTEFSLSDDKEPKGTASRPALEVIKGKNITNICVCIVRYFGGILLGTGGLVKAYSDVTKGVIENAILEPLVERIPFSLFVKYPEYEKIKYLITKEDILVLSEDFSNGVLIKGKITPESIHSFSLKVRDITQNSSSFKIE